MERIYFEDRYVLETWSARIGREVTTGFNALVVANGRISTQTIHNGRRLAGFALALESVSISKPS